MSAWEAVASLRSDATTPISSNIHSHAGEHATAECRSSTHCRQPSEIWDAQRHTEESTEHQYRARQRHQSARQLGEGE